MQNVNFLFVICYNLSVSVAHNCEMKRFFLEKLLIDGFLCSSHC